MKELLYSREYQILLYANLFRNSGFCSRIIFCVNIFKMAENSLNPIPFSEPPYLRGLPSPYITDAHRRFQKACRKFAWENLIQHAMEWEKAGTVPEHVFQTFCKANMLLPNMPAPLPVQWCKRLGINDILGVKVEDWDYIYTGIYCDEVSEYVAPADRR